MRSVPDRITALQEHLAHLDQRIGNLELAAGKRIRRRSERRLDPLETMVGGTAIEPVPWPCEGLPMACGRLPGFGHVTTPLTLHGLSVDSVWPALTRHAPCCYPGVTPSLRRGNRLWGRDGTARPGLAGRQRPLRKRTGFSGRHQFHRGQLSCSGRAAVRGYGGFSPEMRSMIANATTLSARTVSWTATSPSVNAAASSACSKPAD